MKSKKETPKKFEPDFNNLLFTIKIDVYKNRNVLRISSGVQDVNFQTLIGVLETVKISCIADQSAYVRNKFNENLKLNESGDKLQTKKTKK
jgi:hypothetical protein